MLEETDVSRFNALLQQFLSFLEVLHPTFLDYFQREYVSHTQEWAYAYRIGAEINTNMYCESFRRLLKIVYLDSKQNLRVDRLLAVLLRFAKDKAFECIQKLEKGKSSHRMKEILKRHKSALEMVSDGAAPHQESENSWQVHSQSSEQVYTVTRVKRECSCLLHCVDCHACIHMFTCFCANAHLQSTVCKHSHVVQLFLHERSVDPCSTGQKGQNPNDGNDEIVPASVEDEDEGALEMMTYHSEENGEHHMCSPTPGSDDEVVLVSTVSDETDRVHQNVIALSEENGEHLTEPSKTCDIENAVPDSMDYFSRILHSSDSVLSAHELY